MIPLQTIVLNLDGSWTFAWPDEGAAFYRIVLAGQELDRTTELTWTGQDRSDSNYPPPVEIAYEEQQTLSEQFKPYLLLQWYRVECTEYRIQRFDNPNWVTINTIQQNGNWVYSHLALSLEDGTTYEYRVVAVDEVGDESTPRGYRRKVVCPPPPPDGDVLVGYNAGTSSITVVAQ